MTLLLIFVILSHLHYWDKKILIMHVNISFLMVGLSLLYYQTGTLSSITHLDLL